MIEIVKKKKQHPILFGCRHVENIITIAVMKQFSPFLLLHDLLNFESTLEKLLILYIIQIINFR